MKQSKTTGQRASKEFVSKALKGLQPGGSRPGAYNVLQRRNRVEDSERDRDSENDAESFNDNHVHDHEDIIVVVVVEIPTTRPNDQLLVEGVTPTSKKPQRKRQVCIVIAGVILVCFLALLTGKIITWLTYSDSHSSVSSEANSSQSNQTTVPIEQKPSRTGTYSNLTIGEELRHDATGADILSFLEGGRLFLDKVDKPESNFTFFGIRNEANVAMHVGTLLIAKLANPVWNGHVVSAVMVSIVLSTLSTLSLILLISLMHWKALLSRTNTLVWMTCMMGWF